MRTQRTNAAATVSGIVLTLVAASTLVGCGGDTRSSEPAPLSGDAAHIDVELVADLTDDDVTELARSVNDFGIALHRALAGAAPGTNVVTSPLSVSTLLAMVAAGAEGQTAEEMVEVLGLPDVRDDRYAALLRQVSDTDQVELAVANALWLDDDRTLVDDYASFVRDTFGATIDSVPLEDQASADDVDAWVQERTNDRIDGIAEDLGLPSGNAVLVLANAVYFLGEWTTQFDPDDTRPAPFRLASGETVDVPMMHSPADGEFPAEVAYGEGFSMLRLAYGEDGRYVMDVLLPDVDRDLPTLLDQLDAETLAQASEALRETQEPIALPTFELEWDANLNEVLQQLGIRAAFEGGFAPMSPSDPFLGAVVHKTYVRVDEAGTEAAAVTGGVMEESAPQPFLVDRPFAFTITDTDTGTVLFLGSVTDPRG